MAENNQPVVPIQQPIAPTPPSYIPPQLPNVPPVEMVEPRPDASYINPSTGTVEGRVAGILAADSPVMQSARTKAAQQYARRGLLQSQGGVAAGEAAVIDKAIQIAQPDAALYGSLAQSRQKAGLEASVNQQLAEIEKRKYETNALITGSLAQQEQAGKQNLQTMADSAVTQRIQLENQWKDYLQAEQLDSAETQSVMQAAGAMGTQLSGSIERLLRDTNITDKTSAIDALMTQYKSQLNTVAAVAGITLEWS